MIFQAKTEIYSFFPPFFEGTARSPGPPIVSNEEKSPTACFRTFEMQPAFCYSLAFPPQMNEKINSFPYLH